MFLGLGRSGWAGEEILSGVVGKVPSLVARKVEGLGLLAVVDGRFFE